jgi:hypothetical protein
MLFSSEGTFRIAVKRAVAMRRDPYGIGAACRPELRLLMSDFSSGRIVAFTEGKGNRGLLADQNFRKTTIPSGCCPGRGVVISQQKVFDL